MALQARHRYVVTRLNEAFEVNDEEAVEELIRRDSFLQKLNNFFGSRGPERVFFFYEKGDFDKPGNAPLHNKNMVHDDRIALYYSDGSDLAELPESCLQGPCRALLAYIFKNRWF
mgnify:FL=1